MKNPKYRHNDAILVPQGNYRKPQMFLVRDVTVLNGSYVYSAKNNRGETAMITENITVLKWLSEVTENIVVPTSETSRGNLNKVNFSEEIKLVRKEYRSKERMINLIRNYDKIPIFSLEGSTVQQIFEVKKSLLEWGD